MPKASEQQLRSLCYAVADRLAQQWAEPTWSTASLIRVTAQFLRLNGVKVADDHKLDYQKVRQKVLENQHLIDLNGYLERRDGHE